MVKNIIIAMVVMFGFAGGVKAEQNQNYDLYYFYNNTRCGNCVAFEKMTTEVAPTLPVNFKLINVQEPGNQHYLKDFKLYTKAVVIADDKGNYKNLDKIWNYVRDEAKYKQYITDEVNKFVKGNK